MRLLFAVDLPCVPLLLSTLTSSGRFFVDSLGFTLQTILSALQSEFYVFVSTLCACLFFLPSCSGYYFLSWEVKRGQSVSFSSLIWGKHSVFSIRSDVNPVLLAQAIYEVEDVPLYSWCGNFFLSMNGYWNDLVFKPAF